MKKRLFIFFTDVLLIAAALLPCGVWVSAGAETTDTVADYGTLDPERNTTVQGSELLELLLGVEVGDAEAAYVDQSGLYKFVYSESIPASKITARLTADGLRVTASDWTYTAGNGETVRWEPVSITVNAVTKVVDGAGDCLFEGDWDGVEYFEISAEYETEFSVDAALYNSLINYAYAEAENKNGELLVYEAQKAKYDEDLAAYEAACEAAYTEYKQKLSEYYVSLESYNEYLEALEVYNQNQKTYEYYLTRLEQYNAAKAAYDAYLIALDAYNADKALYDAYLSALNDYQRQSGSYTNYLNYVASRNRTISAMEGIFTSNSIGQSLYATILGDTVDTVVKNKDTIVEHTGTPAEAVDLAGECTENLRRMLKEYNDLETEREKYLYYEKNYDELCRNLKYLYEALREFYDHSTVRVILDWAGKLERYRQFLAQLYVITTAIDDSIQRDESWRLKVEEDTYVYVEDLLEEIHILRDTSASHPKNYPGWPEEVAKPVEPQRVQKPTKPDEVKKPGNPPTEIKKPTEPVAVEKPTEPIEAEVEAPGEAPSPVKMTAFERKIVEALRAGQISKRNEVDESVIIKKTTTVSKVIRDLEKHHVRFLSGNTVIFECDIADGGTPIFPTESPVKAATDEFVYSFDCWKDEEGNKVVEEVSVYSDTDFYASFTAKRRSYPITWVVNGERQTDNVEYGAVPVFSGSTDKPMDERRIYTFSGWDNEPVRVTGEATYTAQYSETARLYDVTWNINGVTVTEKYKYAELPSYKGLVNKSADDAYVYTFEGWSPSVSPVTGDVSYAAVYSKKNLVVDMMGVPLSVSVEDSAYVVKTDGSNVDITTLYKQALEKEYGITVQFKDCVLTVGSMTVSRLAARGITRLAASVDENGARFLMCDANGDVIDGGDPVVLEYSYSDDTGAKLSGLVDGREEPVYIEDGKIVLLIASGESFRIIKRYTASVTTSELGSFSLSAAETEAGAEIKLTQETVRDGYVVKQIKVTASLSGEPVDFDANAMTFIMPVGGATVDVVYERLTFTVKFVSEDQVISEKTYYLGDEVEIPEAPVKDPVDKYTYTFAGWTPEVVLVEGDAVYTAIFTEHRIADEVEMREHDFESREFEWQILFGAVAVIVTGGCVAIVCIKSKRKKTRNRK